MRHDDGRGVFMATFHMNKVNVQIIDGCFVLWVFVQAILSVVPVVVAGPVFAKFTVVVDRYALGPVINRFGIRPSRMIEPGL